MQRRIGLQAHVVSKVHHRLEGQLPIYLTAPPPPPRPTNHSNCPPPKSSHLRAFQQVLYVLSRQPVARHQKVDRVLKQVVVLRLPSGTISSARLRGVRQPYGGCCSSYSGAGGGGALAPGIMAALWQHYMLPKHCRSVAAAFPFWLPKQPQYKGHMTAICGGRGGGGVGQSAAMVPNPLMLGGGSTSRSSPNPVSPPRRARCMIDVVSCNSAVLEVARCMVYGATISSTCKCEPPPLCDECGGPCHTHCLDPPLESTPEPDAPWFCDGCVRAGAHERVWPPVPAAGLC
jgi:hypothetical protein